MRREFSKSERKVDICSSFMCVNRRKAVCAYAIRKRNFLKYFKKIKEMDPPIAEYLQGIGFDRWNHAYFLGNRYNVISRNYVESFKNKNREERTFPVTTFVESICFSFQTWFADRREKSANEINVLAPLMQKNLKVVREKEKFLDIHVRGHHDFLVVDGNGDGEMNLVTKSRSCGMF
ncbi:uncharacterized protein LOC133815298 [Humulus lupulus]|uniref:uncharacterized protein LOC133815298 n=1 Tax=Humulus lupulus TaxID=3486 RepID=UPI002B404EC2|nr:uncharacterized protein LOC133815298 [Humulus lupulus]